MTIDKTYQSSEVEGRIYRTWEEAGAFRAGRPEREVMTGIGPVAVRQPRVRDREAAADDPERIHFTPAILPP